ncbi:unnamed protein product [Sphenostylis stenocarpa]|uniref:Uncharacterized protein n=1 Tax=Sphenostylis stenocarpa TaxID=92480 RepID=A0AA86T0V8_9FABA|nr:unnamed protein product [Sphenostylis stenocarpa]
MSNDIQHLKQTVSTLEKMDLENFVQLQRMESTLDELKELIRGENLFKTLLKKCTVLRTRHLFGPDLPILWAYD